MMETRQLISLQLRLYVQVSARIWRFSGTKFTLFALSTEIQSEIYSMQIIAIAGKHEPDKLQIWTFFMQCLLHAEYFPSTASSTPFFKPRMFKDCMHVKLTKC